MGNAEIKRCRVVHFFSCLFPAPSEAPYSCEVKDRSRHEASVSWKVISLSVFVRAINVFYFMLHVWRAACYCTGIKRLIIRNFLIAR